MAVHAGAPLAVLAIVAVLPQIFGIRDTFDVESLLAATPAQDTLRDSSSRGRTSEEHEMLTQDFYDMFPITIQKEKYETLGVSIDCRHADGFGMACKVTWINGSGPIGRHNLQTQEPSSQVQEGDYIKGVGQVLTTKVEIRRKIDDACHHTRVLLFIGRFIRVQEDSRAMRFQRTPARENHMARVKRHTRQKKRSDLQSEGDSDQEVRDHIPAKQRFASESGILDSKVPARDDKRRTRSQSDLTESWDFVSMEEFLKTPGYTHRELPDYPGWVTRFETRKESPNHGKRLYINPELAVSTLTRPGEDKWRRVPCVHKSKELVYFELPGAKNSKFRCHVMDKQTLDKHGKGEQKGAWRRLLAHWSDGVWSCGRRKGGHPESPVKLTLDGKEYLTTEIAALSCPKSTTTAAMVAPQRPLLRPPRLKFNGREKFLTRLTAKPTPTMMMAANPGYEKTEISTDGVQTSPTSKRSRPQSPARDLPPTPEATSKLSAQASANVIHVEHPEQFKVKDYIQIGPIGNSPPQTTQIMQRTRILILRTPVINFYPEGTSVKVVQVPPNTDGCVDDDKFADRNGNICEFYRIYPKQCGKLDKGSQIQANNQCCGCGGGVNKAGPTTHLLPHEVRRVVDDFDPAREESALNPGDEVVIVGPGGHLVKEEFIGKNCVVDGAAEKGSPKSDVLWSVTVKGTDQKVSVPLANLAIAEAPKTGWLSLKKDTLVKIVEVDGEGEEVNWAIVVQLDNKLQEVGHFGWFPYQHLSAKEERIEWKQVGAAKVAVPRHVLIVRYEYEEPDGEEMGVLPLKEGDLVEILEGEFDNDWAFLVKVRFDVMNIMHRGERGWFPFDYLGAISDDVSLERGVLQNTTPEDAKIKRRDELLEALKRKQRGGEVDEPYDRLLPTWDKWGNPKSSKRSKKKALARSSSLSAPPRPRSPSSRSRPTRSKSVGESPEEATYSTLHHGVKVPQRDNDDDVVDDDVFDDQGHYTKLYPQAQDVFDYVEFRGECVDDEGRPTHVRHYIRGWSANCRATCDMLSRNCRAYELDENDMCLWLWLSTPIDPQDEDTRRKWPITRGNNGTHRCYSRDQDATLGLPDGWQAKTDPTTGREVYSKRETGESTLHGASPPHQAFDKDSIVVVQRKIQLTDGPAVVGSIAQHEKGKVAKVLSDGTGSVMIDFNPNAKTMKEDVFVVAEGELWKLRLDESKNPYFKDDVVEVWCRFTELEARGGPERDQVLHEDKWVRGRILEVRGGEVRVEYVAYRKRRAWGEVVADTPVRKWLDWDDAESIRSPLSQVTFDIKVDLKNGQFLGARLKPLPNEDQPDGYLIQDIFDGEDSAIAAYNKAEPPRKVQAGDFIVARPAMLPGFLTLTLKRGLSQEEARKEAEDKKSEEDLRLEQEKEALKENGLALGQLKRIVHVASEEFNHKPCVVVGFHLETKSVVVMALVSELIRKVMPWNLGGEEEMLVDGQRRRIIQADALTGLECELERFSRKYMRWETKVIKTGDKIRFPAECLCPEADLQAAMHGRPKETVHKEPPPDPDDPHMTAQSVAVGDQRAALPYLNVQLREQSPEQGQASPCEQQTPTQYRHSRVFWEEDQ